VIAVRIAAVVAVAAAAAAAVALAAGGPPAGRGPDGASSSRARQAPGVPHVARAGGRTFVADEAGRWLFLRGVAANSLVDYNDDYAETVPLQAGDLREMAALGFDVLRLPVSWSRIAPRPGEVDAGYLDTVAAVVRAAESKGIRVWISMHIDRYNKRLLRGDEADGAPDWATLTDGLPCGSDYRCIDAAWRHFWDDDPVHGKGLQAHYLDALLAVSRRLRSDRGLLGLELMNNPMPGGGDPPGFHREQLWPFYRRMIAGLRADGERRMIWFDRSGLSERTGRDRAERFSDDPNLVLAAHNYTEVFTPPQRPTGDRANLEGWYRDVARDAETFGSALVVAEWGGPAGEGWDEWRAAQLDLQDRHLLGSAAWMWKQRPGFYDWHTVDVNGGLRGDSLRAQQLSRPHPRAVPGVLRSVRLSARRLTVRMAGRGGTATLWGGTVVRRGGRSLLRRPYVDPRIDGRRVRARVVRRRYSTRAVTLVGYEVRVRVPAGRHTIVLSP
jgi:hypothetical protein